MKFEIFSDKFQNAVNVLEMYVRGIRNEEIVDMMLAKATERRHVNVCVVSQG